MADPSFLGCDNVEAARHTAHGLGKIFVLNRIIDQRHPQQKSADPSRMLGERAGEDCSETDRQTDRQTDGRTEIPADFGVLLGEDCNG